MQVFPEICDKRLWMVGDVLATSLTVVQLGGFEPPTSCSTNRRSNQLSYNCILREAP